METILHLVAAQCSPEKEEKFNKWYNETHIPMLLKFPGLKKVTRYKQMYEVEEYPNYLTVYQFESKEAFEAYQASPELAAALEESNETWKEGKFETKWRVQYQPLKTWER